MKTKKTDQDLSLQLSLSSETVREIMTNMHRQREIDRSLLNKTFLSTKFTFNTLDFTLDALLLLVGWMSGIMSFAPLILIAKQLTPFTISFFSFPAISIFSFFVRLLLALYRTNKLKKFFRENPTAKLSLTVFKASQAFDHQKGILEKIRQGIKAGYLDIPSEKVDSFCEKLKKMQKIIDAAAQLIERKTYFKSLDRLTHRASANLGHALIEINSEAGLVSSAASQDQEAHTAEILQDAIDLEERLFSAAIELEEDELSKG